MFVRLCADIQKILRLCSDADWSSVTDRQSSESDPVFVALAQNAVGVISVLKPSPSSMF